MNLRRVLLSLALVTLGLLSACTLRPHYRDVVQPAGASQKAVEGQTLILRVVEPGSGKPIAGARVLAGAGHPRLSAVTDAEGRISVPVSRALLDENPLMEVVLPKGVSQYQFQLARAEEAPAEAPAPQPSEPATGTDTAAPPPSETTPPPSTMGGTDAGV
ncbi:hypothetical protein [Hyalangium rubrum]|uniref:Lipoprotein n=1 Tax=Hyalangium rubrum TaxID=3103134 RepID=A0ABU5HFS8_9BACT|nr:hypothetical protein [Hyalangium sp. s54d21]MDY7232325.1 hypothetical protein [Hyalangium sp. s54d21]